MIRCDARGRNSSLGWCNRIAVCSWDGLWNSGSCCFEVRQFLPFILLPTAATLLEDFLMALVAIVAVVAGLHCLGYITLRRMPEPQRDEHDDTDDD